MLVAGNLLAEAVSLLHDPDNKHWTVQELHGWLNAALREIALHAPQEFTESLVYDLDLGAEQTVPATYSLITAFRCNVDNGNDGAHVIMTTETLISAFEPHWRDTRVVPYTRDVQHVMYDPKLPLRFLVYPGNDGTGKLRLDCVRVPAEVSAGSDPANATTYTANVPVRDSLGNAVVDFICFRAFSKDTTVPSSAARSQQHYASFARALGLRVRTDGTLTAMANGR